MSVWRSLIKKAQWKGWHTCNVNAGTVERPIFDRPHKWYSSGFKVFCFCFVFLTSTGKYGSSFSGWMLHFAAVSRLSVLSVFVHFSKVKQLPKNMKKVAHKKHNKLFSLSTLSAVLEDRKYRYIPPCRCLSGLHINQLPIFVRINKHFQASSFLFPKVDYYYWADNVSSNRTVRTTKKNKR